jgi:hypothetical protein
MNYAQKAQKICSKISILGLAAFVPLASAAIIPMLNPGGPTASGSNFAFSYTADLQQDERLDPAATAGMTCPGPNGAKVQCNPPGTFFTIYDIPDFVSASAPSGWGVVTQLVGMTPSSINGPSIDMEAVMNVTFVYSGPVLHANGVIVPITGFTIVSKDSLTVAVGMPVSQHPPHRSPRAVLPHEAPISDEWRQSELVDTDEEYAATEATGQPV